MPGARPTHVVRARTGNKDDQDRDILQTIGAAWPTSKGTGFTIQISAIPVRFDGFLLITERRED